MVFLGLAALHWTRHRRARQLTLRLLIASLRSSFRATVDLMRRLAASSFQFALQFVSNTLHLDSTARGGDASGSVLDYVVASSSVIAQVRSLEVLSLDNTRSDHMPVCFSWEGRPLSFDGSTDCGDLQTPDCVETPKVLSWRFRGTYTDEKCNAATAHLSEHPGVAQFIPTLRREGPLAAYQLLHRMLRESWASCGISVKIDSGARADVDYAGSSGTGWIRRGS